jgi:hypothetical protein
MLLNLSNHPSVNWSKEQLNAAQTQYGGVVDMPFPPISPEATTDEVIELAKTYARKVVLHTPLMPTASSLLSETVSAVHLMGEMTFVVALVRLLLEAGIEVVCSTTQRTVLEESDGKKTTQFAFVQFRAY